MAPTSISTSKAECDLKNEVQQCLHPQKVFQQFPASQADALKLVSGCISFTYVLGSFLTGVLLLGPRASETACKSIKSGFSIFYRSMVFLDVIPVSL